MNSDSLTEFHLYFTSQEVPHLLKKLKNLKIPSIYPLFMHRKSQTCEFPAKILVISGWKFGPAKHWKYYQHPNKKILQIKFHVHDTSYLQEIITCHSPCDVYLPVQAQEQVYSNIVLEVSVLILVWRQLLQALFSQLDLVHCAGKWYKLAIALFTFSFHCIACIITCKLCGCHN